MTPLKFILVPVGSAGDLHPMLGLARLLARRGHDVVMVAQAIVGDAPRRAGIRTIIVGNRQEQEDILENPRLWHPRKAFSLIAEFIPRVARETLPAIMSEIVSGETVLIGGALAFAARIIAERHNVPLITAHLQPAVFMSVEDPPVLLAHGEWLGRAPKWARKAFFSAAHFRIDRLLRGPIGRLRKEAGIGGPAPRGFMKSWWNSPDAVLALFPEWYGPKAADWPPQTLLTRFPLYDEADERPATPALEKFLSGAPDDPPIVITPGSANVQGAAFLRESLRACILLNRRAILITRFPEQLPDFAGISSVAHFDYLPFSQVFPHAAAIIHHGGIGTTAQALAAGVPQMIMPMAHDQPDNAHRVKRLGVGDYLYPKSFRGPAIAQTLDALLNSHEVRVACARVRQKMRDQMTGHQFGELIEDIAERSLRIRQINGAGVPA